MIGLTFGQYRVLEMLGAGGMGEVYRAHDATLEREVALKVLPHHRSADPGSIDQLKKEARTLASLNHPNIAAVFGLENLGGHTIVVMELVEGTTLAERIRLGRMPLPEVLDIARQIADALEAAHALGIVHRDVKPSNIKVTPEHRVKILDFGLARLDVAITLMSPDASTTAGVTRIAGTPSYMSPEQARGMVTDVRTDIWGFGCVVYEMVTGGRAFDGDTSTDVLAAVLDREPRWDRVPPETPEALHRLLRRCLEKNASRRLRHIADARLEIDEAAEHRAETPPRRLHRAWIAVAAFALVAATTLGWWLATRPGEPVTSGPSPRFNIELLDALPLDGTRQTSFVLSPDGRTLVNVGERNGQRVLLSQTLGGFETSVLRGTEGAEGPFFSPNGEWVGFSSDGKLKKISLRNGSIATICDAPDPRGATWGEDDIITFAPGPFTGLSRVPSSGGAPSEATRLAAEESTHRWPQAAPGGTEIFYTIGSKGAPSFDDADVAVHSLSTGQTTRLFKGTFAQYVDTGHLVYLRGGALMAARFDRRSLAIVGTPAVAIENVGARPFSGTGWYAVARSGALVYAAALGSTDHSLVWVDRTGRATPAIQTQKAYATPRLAPDGSRIVLTVYAPDGTPDLWMYEIQRGSMVRLTSEGLNLGASWSPDGRQISFTSRRAGDPFFKPWVMSSEGENARRLHVSNYPSWATSWTADGGSLAITQRQPASGMDVMVARLEDTGQAEPVVQTKFSELNGVFSPDGRWIAYMSNETGRYEIYLRNVSRKDLRWPVSVEGGSEPVWSRRSNELFFRQGSRVMGVSVERGDQEQPKLGRPAMLFEGLFEHDASSGHANFDVGPPPRDFLMVQNIGQRTHRMTVVLDWLDELRQLAR